MVMDNTSRLLVITLSAAPVNMTVWHAVLPELIKRRQRTQMATALPIPVVSGPAALSAAMSINANEQAIYISSIQNATNTTIPTYTINGSWGQGGTNTGTNALGRSMEKSCKPERYQEQKYRRGYYFSFSTHEQRTLCNVGNEFTHSRFPDCIFFNDIWQYLHEHYSRTQFFSQLLAQILVQQT